MPPKQQDMSVRDEDQLARDQSLDQLKDQLRASLGYEGGADGLVSMESGELHRFMGELGDKIAEHDRLIVAPPWLAKLQAQVARLEGEVVDLRGSLAESRAEVLERGALGLGHVEPYREPREGAHGGKAVEDARHAHARHREREERRDEHVGDPLDRGGGGDARCA